MAAPGRPGAACPTRHAPRTALNNLVRADGPLWPADRAVAPGSAPGRAAPAWQRPGEGPEADPGAGPGPAWCRDRRVRPGPRHRYGGSARAAAGCAG